MESNLRPIDVANALREGTLDRPMARTIIRAQFASGQWKADGLLASGATNAKTAKDQSELVRTWILYLAPATACGLADLCPFRSAGCSEACLNLAGRGIMRPVQDGRLRKTYLYLVDRPRFLAQLVRELDNIQALALRKGFRAVVRLNGTSDIRWEKLLDLEAYGAIQFYDYTKIPCRFDGDLPVNYDLTFSRSESNEADALAVLRKGGRVAVVFRNSLPDTWHGWPVVVGDESDMRFLDGKGVVVGLVAKGPAKHDESGFVVDPIAEDYEFLAARMRYESGTFRSIA